MKAVLSVAAVLTGLSLLAALPADVPNIKKSHPRLFFNSDTWPAVKARAFGPAKGDLDRLVRECERYPENPVCSGYESAPAGWSNSTPLPPVREWGTEAARCALCWRFTGKSTYLEKAKRMLLANVAAYAQACCNQRAVSWYSTSRILSICAYDWIFEALTQDERRAIIVPLLEHVEAVQPGKGRPPIVRRNTGGIETGFYGVQSLLWYAGVAADGDGFDDGLARRLLERGYALMLRMLEYRERNSGDDGALSCAVPGYSMGAYPWAHFNFFHTLASAAGIDAAKHYPGLALFPNWIWWNWIPSRHGPLEFGFGDALHADNALATYTLYEHLAQYAYFWRNANPSVSRLAMALRERSPAGGMGGTWPMYPFIFADIEKTAGFSQRELESFPLKARHFESTGQFVMRSGWKDDSVYCMFTAGGDIAMHRHYDENNFVIYRKGFLALDSGSRAVQTDFNLRHYYAQTVAHNCILVHKEREPLPGYWGVKFQGPEGRYSHGGQCGSAKATVLAFETHPGFTYIASDATKCYGEKCRQAVRQFVWISPGVFVVYDRVRSAEAAYGKEWLLHTDGEPVIEWNLATVKAGESVMYSRTLLPENAAVEKVGGPGREFWASGRNWELDAGFAGKAVEKCAAKGNGPWFGRWRIEVKAPAGAEEARFLHVINVGEDGECIPCLCGRLADSHRDGAKIVFPAHGGHGAEGEVEVFFSRTGDTGGSIRIRRFGTNGRLLREKVHDFAVEVTPQCGVEGGKPKGE